MAADPPRFFVSSNQRVRDRLLAFNRHAIAKGILADWVPAMLEVFERLETEPDTAGAPTHRLRLLNLTVYRLLMNRICVNYAVHDWERVIFVQSIVPVLDHPLEGMA